MKQREIWLTDLNPVKGSEQEGFRPVVIISGDTLNTYLPIVIACPLTTKIKNLKGNIVLEPNEKNGLKEKSEILIFHVRSLSKERMIKKLGMVTDLQLAELKKGLNEILTY